MTDLPNSLDSQPPAPTAEPRGFAGFFATTTGKLVVGAVALIVVVLVVGAIAWAFLFNSGSAGSPQTQTQTIVPAVSSTASGSASAANPAPIVEPEETPLGTTFTFRNVFAPTLKEEFPAPEPAASTSTSSTSTSSGSSSSSGSTTTSSTVKVPADTLYLQSIQTESGSKTATFVWNGSTYTLKEGESIPNSPWKVLTIGSSSVVMLFGDTQVTLSTGQGLNK